MIAVTEAYFSSTSKQVNLEHYEFVKMASQL